MSNELLKSNSDNIPSFEEFKIKILEIGADTNLLTWAAKKYGRIPNAIRALNNFDPTGITGAIDQLFSEEVSEREQNNILRAIYLLAIRIWEIDSKNTIDLPGDKFRFLFLIYRESETDTFFRVDVDPIQNQMGVPQNRIISMGQYLERNGFITFHTWVEGIKILHKGIVKVESELKNNVLPDYVKRSELTSIEDRMRMRFILLQQLSTMTGDDTIKKIRHIDLAEKSMIDHNIVMRQLVPYLSSEGWVKSATMDTIRITEEGLDLIKGIQG